MIPEVDPRVLSGYCCRCGVPVIAAGDPSDTSPIVCEHCAEGGHPGIRGHVLPRAVQLEDLEPAQWEIIASRAASDLPWSEADVGRGKVLTTPQFRAVTRQLASLGYLRLRVPTNPRSGYEWTSAGLRFLGHRWWERLG